MVSKGEKAKRMLAEVMKLIKLNFNKIKDDLTQLGENKVCLICSGLLTSYLGFIKETTSEGLSLSCLSFQCGLHLPKLQSLGLFASILPSEALRRMKLLLPRAVMQRHY